MLLALGPCILNIYSSDEFQDYESGLFDDPTIYDTTNHAVVAVGYGKMNGKDYVKS